MRPQAKHPIVPTRRATGLCLVAVAALLTVACNDAGPVKEVFLFEGQLAYQGSQTHPLITADEGIARFEVLALVPRLVDVSVPSSLVIGLGVGEPGTDGCVARFRTNARVGSIFSIGLEDKTEYCVQIFDPGTLPEDATLDYTVSVSPG